MLRSLGLGLGLETFAKFLRVSVSKNLVSEKKSRFRKNLVSEESLGLGSISRVLDPFETLWRTPKPFLGQILTFRDPPCKPGHDFVDRNDL